MSAPTHYLPVTLIGPSLPDRPDLGDLGGGYQWITWGQSGQSTAQPCDLIPAERVTVAEPRVVLPDNLGPGARVELTESRRATLAEGIHPNDPPWWVSGQPGDISCWRSRAWVAERFVRVIWPGESMEPDEAEVVEAEVVDATPTVVRPAVLTEPGSIVETDYGLAYRNSSTRWPWSVDGRWYSDADMSQHITRVIRVGAGPDLQALADELRQEAGSLPMQVRNRLRSIADQLDGTVGA